ncbi:MAG TPA: response regulator [Pseudomonas sp.]|nr:response regulator [Pseudomonas sp.]
MSHILIVEDETIIRSALRRLLERNQYEVSEAGSVQEAQERYSIPAFDLIVSDLRLPGAPGTELIRLAEGTPVLIMTSYASLRSAVDSMKLGAVDYIAKPFDHDEMLQTVARILSDRQQLASQPAIAREAPPSTAASSNQASDIGIIGHCAPMLDLFGKIRKVAPTDSNVLIQGESGTGKELVARAIHDCGSRRSQAFVVQNCAALPEHLLESELFGYRKGAFTGAERDHEGLFDAANGGTLFLDEIGDMPLTLQAKLLRVLQEGEVRPLGSTRTHKVDVRIVAATHQDLHKRVEEGRFREDLYYRLSLFPIELPPLRERDQDILRLARHFADKACGFLQRDTVRWSDAALEQLAAYAFPGNVRELKGLVERAVLLCDGGELLPEHFSLRAVDDALDSTLNLRERLERVERNLLVDSLRKNGGNQSQAARELGLPRRTLLYRMERLGVSTSNL